MITPIKNSRFFFFKGNVKYEDGYLIWKDGMFSETRIKVSEISAVAPVKGGWMSRPCLYLFNGKSDMFHTCEHQLKFPIGANEDQLKTILDFLRQNNAKIYSDELRCVTLNEDEDRADFFIPERASFIKRPTSLWEYDDYVDLLWYHNSVWNDHAYRFDKEDIRNIIFFADKGKELYFGGRKSPRPTIKHPKRHFINKIQDLLVERNAKIAEFNGEEFSPTFNFRNWLKSLLKLDRKESLVIGEDAIQFHYKKGKKEDYNYLPLEDIYSYNVKLGLFRGSFRINGIVNIEPKLKYKKSTLRELRSLLRERVKVEISHEANRQMFNFMGMPIFPRRKKYGALALVKEDYLLYLPEKKRRKKGDGKYIKVDFDDIYGYYFKRPWLLSWKRNGIIFASSNIRDDQGDEHEVIILNGYNHTRRIREILSEKCKNNGKTSELRKDYKHFFK